MPKPPAKRVTAEDYRNLSEAQRSSTEGYCVEFSEAEALYVLERVRNGRQSQSEDNWLEAI